MKFLIAITVFFGSFNLWAVEPSCFPISKARHDRECYDFDNKNECLETTDVFSCGWGQRREDPTPDDDLLICDDSRCPNMIDSDEDELLD